MKLNWFDSELSGVTYICNFQKGKIFEQGLFVFKISAQNQTVTNTRGWTQ